jgi:hypothetical protein
MKEVSNFFLIILRHRLMRVSVHDDNNRIDGVGHVDSPPALSIFLYMHKLKTGRT